ncbi:hypothetical protein BTO23_17820 [Aliivibrio sifiae]|uniref:Uncharacterized protein n=1 Tax=Aliivibrio sifiae TaxID=566293 RepID=A0A2S7X9A6_9GAMM|nr:hypothetical protein BTO23_17820 [Aliivibrio sifiae]GLR73582.1 hypothetical protein GCM10007855_04550 [Aliivibrio sifiae]
MKNIALLLLLLLLLSSNGYVNKSNIVIQYMKPESKSDEVVKRIIKDSDVNSIFLTLSQKYFPFNNKLIIQYGGLEEPSYNPINNTINIPYSFFQRSASYFVGSKHQEMLNIEPQQGALDSLLHTLLHEAGHAFIAEQKLVILGKEEDAVDDFATLLLLEYIEGGDNIAINAAKMFSFESEHKSNYYDFGEFIGEHSFDLQRYFSILCLVYGNQEIKHNNLLNEIEDEYLFDIKEYCKFRYEKTETNWNKYLINND